MASVGETLRSAREQRGLTIEQVSHDTRISVRFLEALEADHFDALPAPVYVRGFIRSYASYLKLDGPSLLAALDTGAPPAPPGRREAPANGAEARRADPFQRTMAAPPRPSAPPPVLEEPEPFTAEPDFNARQTIRRRGPLPVPPVDTFEEDDLGDDGLLRVRPAILTEHQGEGRGIARWAALVGVAVIGVAIAAITAAALTGGGDDGVATSIPDAESPDRGGGSVVVVGSQTPRPAGTGTATRTASLPGGPSGGSQTPSNPSDDDTPPANEDSTPTPDAQDETETPEPAATPVPTETPTVAAPTATPELPTPTPPIPTPTAILSHPYGEAECTVPGPSPCGPPPLRVICAPDGWFIDVGRDFLNPGWPENNTALHSGAARDIGERNCV